jgi:hypothetical protein
VIRDLFCKNKKVMNPLLLLQVCKLHIKFTNYKFAPAKDHEFIKMLITDNGIGRTKAKQYSLMSTGKGLEIVHKTVKSAADIIALRDCCVIS